MDRQDQRLKALEARVKELERADRRSTPRERERRDAQFGTLEVRLGRPRAAPRRRPGGVTAAPRSTTRPLAEGRGLLDEVRTEHARIRARMQVVSAYEERLRRVEESVAELFEGDRRHPV